MKLSTDSNYILNILSGINNFSFKKTKSTKECFLYFFDIFLKFSNVSVKRIIHKRQINSISSANFLSDKICEFINKNKSTCVTYKFFINNREITVNYFNFNNKLDLNYLDTYTNYVAIIIYLLSLHSFKQCNNTLNIKIYLTPYKRSLSDNLDSVIGVHNVNGGYTHFCHSEGEIVVYRKEEWLKVVIHECIHSFGLEFSNLDLREFNKNLKKELPINSDFNIFESYTEIWAEIINICLIAFLYCNRDKKLYLDTVYNLLKYEIVYSNFQCEKVLSYNNIKYSDLFNKNNNYREESNVFAYYIVKTLLIENIDEFIEWCYTYNINYINFKKNNKILNLFLNFIKKLLKKQRNQIDVDFAYLFNNHYNNFFVKNLRMTAVEL